VGERDRDATPESPGHDPAEPAQASSAPAIDSLLRGDLQRSARSGGPTDPAMAAQLRRLQRSAGNASVVRMLREVAPPATEAAPAASGGGLIVDDEGAEPAAGQMRAAEFLDEAHKRASAAAKRELGLIFTIAGCPWLDHWIDYYRTRSAAAVEAAIRRYAPATAGATSAAQYLAAIEQRVGEGITAWRETGEIPAAPTEGGDGGAPAPGGAPASVARTLLDEPGSPLDPAVASQVGSAFGRDFSGVRIHAGSPATGIAGQLGSRAVTVGRHVAFAPGEYEPGTPLGNALIAHELAHVVQQEGGGVARTPAGAQFETEADSAAQSALLASYAPDAKLARRVVPALRTGLTLQSCPGGTATASSFENLIKIPDYDRAAALLSTETDDNKVLAKVKDLTATHLAKLDEAVVKLGAAGERAHRVIRFVQNPPPAVADHAGGTIKDAGTLGHAADVGGGKVEAHYGVTYNRTDSPSVDRPDRFTIDYKGPEAEKTRWLQFIWREVECEGHPTRGTYRVDEEVESSAKNKYKFTTDTAKPVYNTDSASATDPFYESGFVNNRSADATTIFDLPASFQHVVKRQFDAGATKVTSRAHFTTYLVRDTQVMHQVTTDITWEFTSGTVEPPRKTKQGGGAANAIDPMMRKVLVVQYPKFDYLP